MKEMSSREWHEAVRKGLDEVARRLASGELDQSGRYYTDEELAAGMATGTNRAPRNPPRRLSPDLPRP
jgi:hypothetical protein